MRTRLLPTLLALCTALILLPGTARAEDNWTPYEAEAREGGNYTISTAAQLQALAGTVNGGQFYANTNFKLTADIDLSSVCGVSVDGKGEVSWTPIGSIGSGFAGAFDGDNHKITGLYINSTDENQGLFASVGEDGTVKNVGVSGSISGHLRADWIYGRYLYVGGVVVFNSGTVTNCYYAGDITVENAETLSEYDNANVGGVVGVNSGTVTNCYNTGGITVKWSDGFVYAGGVVGNTGSKSAPANCYNTGNIVVEAPSSWLYAGGVVGTCIGMARDGGGSLINCCNEGDITAECSSGSRVGGVAGACGGAGEPTNFTVENCYNVGGITVNGSAYVGGVVGDISRDTVKNCYNEGDITAECSFGSRVGGVAGYNNGMVTGCHNIGDITTETAGTLGGHPVGGVVGDNYGSVENCYNAGGITGSDGSDVGGVVGRNGIDECFSEEFAWMYGAVTVINCYNTGDIVRGAPSGSSADSAGSAGYAGGVVGFNYGTVANCYSTGNIKAEGSEAPEGGVGGVVGVSVSGSTVAGCYNTGSITAETAGTLGSSPVGGVAGIGAFFCTITKCYNTGDITVEGLAHTAVGGVTGSSSGSLTNCYNTGDITVKGSMEGVRIGGVTGTGYETPANCYNIGGITVKGSMEGVYIGGIVGGSSRGTPANCYYLKENGINSEWMGIGGASEDTRGVAEGLTDEQMKRQASFVNWDFDEIWSIDPAKNGGYPYLLWQNLTGSDVVHVAGVSLNKTELTLAVGDSETLRATVAPSGAANQNVSWASSDNEVAAVSNGTVRALKAGTTVITVTTEDGGYTAECAVTVTAGSADDPSTDDPSTDDPSTDDPGTDKPAPDTYTVTFDANGGSVSPASAAAGADGKLSSLPTPTRDGYAFGGWYTAAEGGEAVTTSTVFTKNTTVYAHWTKNETPGVPSTTYYMISLSGEPSGGGSVTGSGTYREGESAVVTAVPSSGYVFIRWTENGRRVSYSAEYTFTVTTSRALTAEFELIDRSASSSGSVSSSSASSGRVSSSGGSVSSRSASSSSVSSGSNSAALRSNFIKNTVDSMPRMPSASSIASIPSITITPSTTSGIYSDVLRSSTFAPAITWAQNNGIMGGYADGTFRPYGGTNRQQMWMALARLSGANPAGMAEARAWAISSGISDGSNAEGIMNRQQMAAMLYRYAKSQGMTTSGSADLSTYYDSSEVAPYAREAMAWAAGNGFMTGIADGSLKPDSTALRAHFVTFLYRFSSL